MKVRITIDRDSELGKCFTYTQEFKNEDDLQNHIISLAIEIGEGKFGEDCSDSKISYILSLIEYKIL
jgi:hypothetical protein